MADRLISADDLIERAYRLRLDDRERVAQMIESAPTVEVEPTEEQVREYCLKRCLTVVTTELFNEMKARWSNEPVRHGHWEYHTRHQRDCVASCSVCRKRTTFFFKNGTKYCPFCGAKMDGGEDDPI